MANLATLPPPHGSPHPTTHLTTYLYVFCVQRAQKRCLMIKIQLLLHFSKVGGGKSILAFFGLWWPSFSATGSPGVAQKCQTRVSPCYTYGNPCQNICRACSINFMQFLNTPVPGSPMLSILLPGTQNLLAESPVCSLNFGWVFSTKTC